MKIRIASIEDFDILIDMFIKKYNVERENNIFLPEVNKFIERLKTDMKYLLEKSAGVVAEKDGKIIGYMLSFYPIDNFKGSQKGAYTPEWAHGVNYSNEEIVYYAMFAELWEIWIKNNCYNHCISYLSNENRVERFLFDMSYGMIVEDAIIIPDSNIIDVELKEDVVIRPATKNDMESLLAFVTLLINHLNEKPVFRYGTPPTIEDAEYEFFEKPGICLVAEYENRIIGCMRGHFNETTNSDIVVNDKNIAIDYAYVKPYFRGQNIGKKLLSEFSKSAKSVGMETCSVDYETHNYKAAIYWRNHFKVFNKSAIRKIDDRF